VAKDWTQDEVIKDLERVIEKQDKEIERLREAAKDRPKDRPNEAADEIERLREALRLMPKTITDAANEIERLRKALTELDSAINQWLSTGSVMKKWMLKIIADALKGGE